MNTDLLIIGAGPAGMEAALAAASSGLSSVLLDDNPASGGQIWRGGPAVALPKAAQRLVRRLQESPGIHRLNSTRVVALAGTKALLVEDDERGFVIHYERLILCTGARERLLPFPGWTLPGVTGAGGLQALVKGGLPVAGEAVIIAGSGPLLLAAAATARKAGARLLDVAEQAPAAQLAAFVARLPRWPGKLIQAGQLYPSAYHAGSHVLEALGDKRLEAVRLRRRGRDVELACDRLACGFGLVPNTELGQALGCALQNQAIAVDAFQRTGVADVFAAGECTGFGGSELARIEGAIAGYVAADNRAAAERLFRARRRWQAFAALLERTFALTAPIKSLAQADTLLCRCEDVPYAAVAGHADWREAKLATRCGMGACQGRLCGTAARTLFGWELPAPRPPFVPARIGTLTQLDESAS